MITVSGESNYSLESLVKCLHLFAVDLSAEIWVLVANDPSELVLGLKLSQFVKEPVELLAWVLFRLEELPVLGVAGLRIEGDDFAVESIERLGVVTELLEEGEFGWAEPLLPVGVE